MKKILKIILFSFFRLFYNNEYISKVGAKRLFSYFIFQKIFRINSDVKWPVHWASIVSSPNNIQKPIGAMPGLMPGCYIQAINGIVFGKNVIIAPGVKIVSASHDLNEFSIHTKVKPIKIGDNCWLAANSVILPGVELGNHTIVAAGAVVNKSFETGNCVLGGVPAKIIKKLESYKGID